MPLAGFSLQATVLSRRDYATGREADYSPTDLALGWGRMQDQAVLSRLDIDQSGRWYHYRWSGEPPIAPEQIALSSANMHMIPADAGIAAALHRVQRGDRVRIEGWLVQVDGPDGWHWRSSLSRGDTGAAPASWSMSAPWHACSARQPDQAATPTAQLTPVPPRPQ